MDDLPLVEKLVTRLAQASKVPVSCKIRVFPKLEDTLAYARMVERSGCCLLAVHGRTREQKDNSRTRADWDQIRAVKQACLELVRELRELIAASGRTAPVPAISARALERMAREEARLAAIAEQDREEAGLQALSAAPGSVE
ncbi:uncharacterized protein HaLaN_01838, partial [Haematococcus lacustris]